jgi:MoaA/NifB/PqqE/SkfB family radical SAM enzyme
MKTNNSKTQLNSIEEIFKDKFPEGYKNNVAHWGNFSKEDLHQKLDDGTYKLKHMDIDLGNICSLACKHCFRRDDRSDSVEDLMNEETIISYLKEAKELGLESVKFLGRGEPFQNKNFLGFLKKLYDMGIGASIFTKGHVIGDDKLAKAYNSQYGINNGQELADKLKELDVSILIGFNSFDKETQNEYVGGTDCVIKNYATIRDKAIERLVKAGLNEYVEGKETRLALITAPVKPENVEEVSEIYAWGRRRNMYVISCPSTVSGKGIEETKRAEQNNNYLENLKQQYVKNYIFNIENELMTLDQFKEEGVSLYPGAHVCTQTAAGMYMMLSGKVVRCPGRLDNQSTFSEDIRKEKSLKEVWINSENYGRASYKIKSPEGNDYNYHCPARDGHSLKYLFYENIKREVLNHFE